MHLCNVQIRLRKCPSAQSLRMLFPKIKFNTFLFKMIIFYNLISYVYCALLRFTVTYNKVYFSTVKYNIIKAVHLLMYQCLYFPIHQPQSSLKILSFLLCIHVNTCQHKMLKNERTRVAISGEQIPKHRLHHFSFGHFVSNLRRPPTTYVTSFPGITGFSFRICILMARESQRLHRHASTAGRNSTS